MSLAVSIVWSHNSLRNLGSDCYWPSPDIRTRCSSLVNQSSARENQNGSGKTMDATGAQNLEINSSSEVDLSSTPKVPPMDGRNSGTGGGGQEEQVLNRFQYEHPDRWREGSNFLQLERMAEAASDEQGNAVSSNEAGQQALCRGGDRGLSVIFSGNGRGMQHNVKSTSSGEEKTERNPPTSVHSPLQALFREVGVPHIPGFGQKMASREPLHYRLFVCEPALYHLATIPPPPPSFPAAIIEHDLHLSGISTHIEYPVDDPAVLEGIEEGGGIDFAVFWLANYRNRKPEEYNNNISLTSGMLYVAVDGELVGWSDEDGIKRFGGRPYGKDVRKRMVDWAKLYL